MDQQQQQQQQQQQDMNVPPPHPHPLPLHGHHQQAQHHHNHRPIVTSASEHEDDDNDDDNDSRSSHAVDDSEDDAWSATDTRRQVYFPSDLLDETLDEQDEAYVYQHLRSGTLETVAVARRRDNNNDTASSPNTTATTTTMQVLKPRNSDAVLSCPCCFTIVCMDCQRHERHLNQFRAMFVMNIAVNWHETWVYNDLQQQLVMRERADSVSTTTEKDDRPVDNCYYTVTCAGCQTQVAVLDMSDEVYHFTGCLASS